MLKERAKTGLRFLWGNADAALVIAVAAGVVVAEVMGSPSPEVVDSAILDCSGSPPSSCSGIESAATTSTTFAS